MSRDFNLIKHRYAHVWAKSLHAMSFLLWCLTRMLTLQIALHHMPRKCGRKLCMLCSFPYWIKSAHLMGQTYNRMLYPNLKKVLDLFVKIWDLSWGFKIDGSFCKVYVVFSVGENVWLVSCIEQSVFYFFFPWLLSNRGSVISSFMVWCVRHPLPKQ